MRFHLILPEDLAVNSKLHVHALAEKFIESQSQSFPTRHVATFQDADTTIFDVEVIAPSVIVNRAERTGTHEPKSISVSVIEKLHDHHGIFIVVVAPDPLAVTPAHVKFNVVTVVERVDPSSCVVIVAATDGVANVPSHLKNVVVLFGGVGTHPHTVEVIVATLVAAIGVENVCTHVKVFAESVRANSASVTAVLNCANVQVIQTIDV